MENFDEMNFEFVKVNFEGKIISYNLAFEKNILSENKKENYFEEIIINFDFTKEEQQITIKEKLYSAFLKKLNDGYNIFFIPIQIPNEYKTMVSLIFIDNYDEVLESIEEFRRPLLVAIVDRKIKKMAKDFGGVVKNFEKDKYIFIVHQDKLANFKESKFEILEQVKEIDMGNNIPVTLSIGIGINGMSLDENMEFARASIDLALSRGGAQVVIKDGENYQFFGGHSQEVGKNSRVKARVKAYAFTELIEASTNVIIMGHKNIDFDCIGAGIGVYAIAKALEKECKIVLNSVTSSVSNLYSKIVQEEKYKNAFISTEEALKITGRKTLLVIVDVYKGSLCEAPELLEKAKKIVVFDHHRKGAEYIENAVLTYHEPYASSTCELITEMLLYMNKTIPMRPIEADAILAGVIVDTKNFVFKTGIKTFETASFLKKKGADTIRVKKLFRNSLELYTAKAEIVKKMETYKENIAISTLEQEVENPILVIAQACDELLNIDNVNASFVLCKNGTGINISARSFGEINVQIIMEKLGGGGHQSVSATQIKDMDMEEAKTALKNAIEEYFKEE